MVYNRGRAIGNTSQLSIAYISSLAFLSSCAHTLPQYEPLSQIKTEDASPSVLRANYESLTQDEACEAVGLALLSGIRDNHKLKYDEKEFILVGDRSITSLYTSPLKSCDTFLSYVNVLNSKLRKVLEKELITDPVSPYSFEANQEVQKLVGNYDNKSAQHVSACRLEGICLGRPVDNVITPLDEFAQYLYILNNLSVTNSNGNINIAAPEDQLNEVVQRRWEP
jgi:hypothetical protein